jgi:hypothetical protein
MSYPSLDDLVVKVFVSYKGKDDSLCESIKQGLQAAIQDIQIQVDWRLLLHGKSKSIHRTLRGHLYDSDIVVALLTDAALESREVFEELIVAHEWQIPIVPVVAKRNLPELPWFLGDVERIEQDLDAPDRSQAHDVGKNIIELVNRIITSSDRDRLRTERRIRDKVRSIGQHLSRMTQDHTVSADIRLSAIQEVLNAAEAEVELLSSKKHRYLQNLSVESNFLIRALPSFSKADRIYAVSVDFRSTFWSRPDQFEHAKNYLVKQRRTTRRLFSFSHAKSAHNLRNILAAHHRRYGTNRQGDDQRGGVFLCTEQQYYGSFIESILEGETRTKQSELAVKFREVDFGILVFERGGKREYRELTLSNSIFTSEEVGDQLAGYQQRVIDQFEALMHIRPGEFDPTHHILRWHDKFATDLKAWERILKELFFSKDKKRKTRYGTIYHLVFFSKSVDRDRLLGEITRFARDLEETTGEVSTEAEDKEAEIWFGEHTEDLKNLVVTDSLFGGEILIDRWFVEQYPYCLIKKVRNVNELRLHYESESHSEARQAIFSVFDGRVIKAYTRARSSSTPSEKKDHYESAEAHACRFIVRVDLQECEDIGMIVQGKSIDHGWANLWKGWPSR